MRRLPVYLVLDVSGSMHGEKIEAVRNGMQMLVSTLRTDPYALETAHLSVIVFDDTARQVVPLTELIAFQPPQVVAGSTTSLGDARGVACGRRLRTSFAEPVPWSAPPLGAAPRCGSPEAAR